MADIREGGCHCGRVRFRAKVDLALMSQCSCTICVKKGIMHLPVQPEDLQLLSGRDALKIYTFGTGTAQHAFCAHCGIHAFYVPRSNPDRFSVNASCLDGISIAELMPRRFFDGRDWEGAQARRIAAGEHTPPTGPVGAATMQGLLDRALG
jgi:hypothetical protein